MTPTRHVVQNLVGGALVDDVEEVVAFDQIAQRSANEIEVWVGGCIGRIFRIRHRTAIDCRVAYRMRVTDRSEVDN